MKLPIVEPGYLRTDCAGNLVKKLFTVVMFKAKYEEILGRLSYYEPVEVVSYCPARLVVATDGVREYVGVHFFPGNSNFREEFLFKCKANRLFVASLNKKLALRYVVEDHGLYQEVQNEDNNKLSSR